MRQDVAFKGINGNIQLAFREGADFVSVMKQLEEKLSVTHGFFSEGMVVHFSSDFQRFQTEEKDQLIQLFQRFGVSLKELPFEPAAEHAEVSFKDEEANEEEEVMVLTKTVRSGQKFIFPGNVVIHGDINPGGQVIAGGDIVISGACRGIVHAGAFGNVAAKVIAKKLMPTQLRIAGLLTRAPDHLDVPAYEEVAHIENEQIVVEPSERVKEAL